MTANQIKFAELNETKRHNVRTEDEMQRHNVRTENQSDVSIGESIRHNKESERVNWYSASQNAAIGWGNIAENQRHNIAVEDYTAKLYQQHGKVYDAEAALKHAQEANVKSDTGKKEAETSKITFENQWIMPFQSQLLQKQSSTYYADNMYTNFGRILPLAGAVK